MYNREWAGLQKRLEQKGKPAFSAGRDASSDMQEDQDNEKLIDKPRRESVCGTQKGQVEG